MAQKQNTKLGRGLASLLEMDDDDFELEQNFYGKKQNNFNEDLKELDVEDIVLNSKQPREYFDDIKLQELSESIKNNGLLQPIITTKIKYENKYIIVAGERRYRACKLAGFKKIKAIVLNLTEKEILKNAIIENVQRENLNPIEEANGYKKIIDTFGYTHEQLAKEIGKSRVYITNLLRILTLPDDIKKSLKNKEITLGHAKVLLSAKKPMKYLSKIINNHLSVRQLENIISKNLNNSINHKNEITDSAFALIKNFYKNSTNVNKKDNQNKNIENKNNENWEQINNNIKFIEKQLSESCGFNVCLKLNQDGSGKLEIHFDNSDSLLELINLFK